MRNRAFLRAMNGLAHPISIGAISVLLLNDHIFKRLWPSWWTGKLSDFAWLAFAPLVLAALLAWPIPARLRRREEFVGSSAFVLTGLVFALANTVPGFHRLTVRVLEVSLGGPIGLVRDPTDLMALPALSLGWYLWKQPTRPLLLRERGWVALALACMATIATSPPTYDYGISCLAQQQFRLEALTSPRDEYEYATPLHVFYSVDGGLSWQEEPLSWEEEIQVPHCAERVEGRQLSDPADGRIRYRYTPGEAIERSEDKGQTWDRELTLSAEEARSVYHERFGDGPGATAFRPGPLDALVQPSTGHVVFAMGHEGVLVRTPDAQWHWVPVGPYRRVQLNTVDAIQSLLSSEFWLALISVGLIIATMARHFHRLQRRTLWLIAGWFLWGLAILSPPLGPGLAAPIIGVAAIGAIALGLNGIVTMGKSTLPGRILLWSILIGIGGALLFVLPYVLWTQDAIPQYRMAMALAVGLVAATLFAGDRYVQRLAGALSLPPKEEKPAVTPTQRPVDRRFWIQWVLATVLGRVLSGVIFVYIAFVFLFGGAGNTGLVGEAIMFEILSGAVVGILLWLVLRRYVQQAGWWVLAVIAGWVLGQGLVLAYYFGKAGAVGETGVVGPMMFEILAGAFVGFLVWLVLRRRVQRAGRWVLTVMAASVMGQLADIGFLSLNLLFLDQIASPVIFGMITGGAFVWLSRRSAAE